jgi:hypothetical protein
MAFKSKRVGSIFMGRLVDSLGDLKDIIGITCILLGTFRGKRDRRGGIGVWEV